MEPAKTTTEGRRHPAFFQIGDTAGVASVLAKYLEELYSLGSDVVNYYHPDPWRITEFYGWRLHASGGGHLGHVEVVHFQVT